MASVGDQPGSFTHPCNGESDDYGRQHSRLFVWMRHSPFQDGEDQFTFVHSNIITGGK